MNTFIRSLAFASALALGIVTAASAVGAPDPAIGTWTINLEKSKFSAGHAPKSMSRTYTAKGNATEMSVTGTAADGSAVSQQSTLTYDGKECAFTGAPDFDSLVLTKVNGSTVKSTQKKAGKVVGHTVRTISGHGKILTLDSHAKDSKGSKFHDIAVYDKH